VTDIDRLEQARLLYERAVFGGEEAALTRAMRELDAVEADLALARGRILHARFLETRQEDPEELALFERAAAVYRDLGDARSEGEARFWIGCFHQVVRDDFETGLPALRRSYELATAAGDDLTLSYAARHLGFAEGAAGRVDAARERLEESLRLRRELGFMPGVAAALLGLAELAKRQGKKQEALALADEAEAVAEASAAAGVLRWVERLRDELQ
jgi:tetratricopeptide (TPR) repeat protein